MADIRITPGSSIMNFTSSLNYVETLKQDASGSLNLYGSGSTGRTELFSIDGNNGRLFTVSDDLSDSLFSVNTIAGLPVIEAFANNTVVMGQYGTNALVVSGSNVGIGTTSPSYKLDVNGSTRITGTIQGATMPPAGTSGGAFTINQYPDYHNSFYFYSRNDTDQDGFGAVNLSADPENGIYLASNTIDNSRISAISFDHSYFTLSSGGNFYFNTKPSTSFQTSLFIKNTGEVGIGTVFPTNKLTILGTDDTIPALGSSGGKLGIFNGVSGTPKYGLLQGVLSNGNSYLQAQRIDGTATAYNLLLQPNGGNVGIGTTSPSYPLYVATQVSNISIYATYDIVAYSDISVKTNIRPIDNVLERVINSRGVLYDRIDSGEKNNIGFIAQELEEQFPELIVENPDGTKAVKYQNAVAILFEAIKEQQKQINELKNGITN